MWHTSYKCFLQKHAADPGRTLNNANFCLGGYVKALLLYHKQDTQQPKLKKNPCAEHSITTIVFSTTTRWQNLPLLGSRQLPLALVNPLPEVCMNTSPARILRNVGCMPPGHSASFASPPHCSFSAAAAPEQQQSSTEAAFNHQVPGQVRQARQPNNPKRVLFLQADET
jgi:hypothetical protein